MEQYVDKSALVAEIERRAIFFLEESKKKTTSDDSSCATTLYGLLSFINTLEVKEVDLEKELDYDDYMSFFKEHPEYNDGDWGFDECWVFAEHFFKLGLKVAQQEE